MVSRRPTYSLTLPAMANCETCDWSSEGKVARKLAADHWVATNGEHYIRLNQDRTAVWEPPRYRPGFDEST